MVHLSAFSDEVSSDFKEQVNFLVSQKIKFMEIRFVNNKNIMDLGKTELKEVKSLLKNNGISISAIGSPIGKIRIDEDFNIHLNKFIHAIELAQFLEAPFLRIFSYYPPVGENIQTYREEVLYRMQKKIDILGNTDLILVHENESHIYGHSAKNCVDLVGSINSPKLKLAYDPANFVWGDHITDNVDQCWPLMKPFVVHVHIKDWKLGNNDIGCMPGEGDGQIKQLLSELNEMNYKGFLTMEPHLKTGGQFGGDTGSELFELAIDATRELCNETGIKLF